MYFIRLKLIRSLRLIDNLAAVYPLDIKEADDEVINNVLQYKDVSKITMLGIINNLLVYYLKSIVPLFILKLISEVFNEVYFGLPHLIYISLLIYPSSTTLS